MILGGTMRLLPITLAFCLAVTSASAQAPACPQIRIISPYTTGGATDVLLRLLIDRLGAALNRTVFIENRPGASSNIGTAFVAKATPDGCTLVANGTMIATYPHSYSNLTYDPLKDLVPVGGIGATPTFLVTATSNEWNDIPSLVKSSKTQPQGFTFGSAGLGLLQHLSVEAIGHQSGAKFIHVIYPGSPAAIGDLITGRIDFGSFTFSAVNPSIQAGRLKALAVLQDTRSALAPDVPTVTDQGLAALDARVQFVLFAPAGTPQETVSLLGSELMKIVADPALIGSFYKIGFEPTPATSEQAAEMMRRTAEYWGPVIKRLNIKLH